MKLTERQLWLLRSFNEKGATRSEGSIYGPEKRTYRSLLHLGLVQTFKFNPRSDVFMVRLTSAGEDALAGRKQAPPAPAKPSRIVEDGEGVSVTMTIKLKKFQWYHIVDRARANKRIRDRGFKTVVNDPPTEGDTLETLVDLVGFSVIAAVEEADAEPKPSSFEGAIAKAGRVRKLRER